VFDTRNWYCLVSYCSIVLPRSFSTLYHALCLAPTRGTSRTRASPSRTLFCISHTYFRCSTPEIGFVCYPTASRPIFRVPFASRPVFEPYFDQGNLSSHSTRITLVHIRFSSNPCALLYRHSIPVPYRPLNAIFRPLSLLAHTNPFSIHNTPHTTLTHPQIVLIPPQSVHHVL